MPLQLPIQVYRGVKANLATLASTGKQGVLVWTTDTNELFADTGSGVGIPAAWAQITSPSNLQELSAATAHQFVTYIDTNGVQHMAQPEFTDVSGQLTQAQLPASIDCGTF